MTPRVYLRGASLAQVVFAATATVSATGPQPCPGLGEQRVRLASALVRADPRLRLGSGFKTRECGVCGTRDRRAAASRAGAADEEGSMLGRLRGQAVFATEGPA